MPETQASARPERPEPRTGGAMGAAVASALLGAALRIPEIFFVGALAPFPLLVIRLRMRGPAAWMGLASAAAALAAVFSPGQSVVYLLLVVPAMLIGETMARGRGMLRGCGWAFALLTFWIGATLLFANPQMQALATEPLAYTSSPEFLERLRASGIPADQIDAISLQMRSMYSIVQVVYPAVFIIGGALVVMVNAMLLRLYLFRRDPGWLDMGEFESLRWPFALAVAFVVAGLAVLVPTLRPAAYNVLLLIAFFFALQGLAVVGFYTQRLAAPPLLRLAVLLLVLINPWAPQILGLVGLFDTWFDFRKWALPPEARGTGAGG